MSTTKKKRLDLWELRLRDSLHLLAIKKIKDVDLDTDTWYDDHVLCFNLDFTDNTNYRWRIAWFWAGEAMYGAALYANDSRKACNNLLQEMKNVVMSYDINDISKGDNHV